MPDNKRWFAIQVQSTREKLVSTLLRHKGYEEFTPVYQVESGRAKGTEKPLFPGYLFCRCEYVPRVPPSGSAGILTTPGVIRILGFNRTPEPVEDSEIEGIRRLLSSRMAIQPLAQYAPGQQVKIMDGPLKNVEGVIITIAGDDHLVVSVSLLQRSVSVKIDKRLAQIQNPISNVEMTCAQVQ